MQHKVATLIASRKTLIESLGRLAALGLAPIIGGNDANFVVQPILSDGSSRAVPDNNRAQKIYKRLAEECGVVVRYRGGEFGCKGCLRITVGSEKENRVLLDRLEESLRLTLPGV